MLKKMMLFSILSIVASCRSDFPRIKPQLACSVVLTKKADLYEADCRCALYDLENTKYIEDFKRVEISFCDRGHIYPREIWEIEIEPYVDEIREFVEDELKEQKSLEAMKSLQENNFNPNY